MRHLHIYISMFFLPMFLFYVITGILFLTGQRSRGLATEEHLAVKWPHSQVCQLSLANQYLTQQGIKIRPPDKIKSTTVSFFWGHSGSFSVSMSPSINPDGVNVKIYKPTLHSKLMAFHANRAKGDLFQVFAVIFSLGWLLSYCGIFWKQSVYKSKKNIITLMSGLALTFIISMVSF